MGDPYVDPHLLHLEDSLMRAQQYINLLIINDSSLGISLMLSI